VQSLSFVNLVDALLPLIAPPFIFLESNLFLYSSKNVKIFVKLSGLFVKYFSTSFFSFTNSLLK